MILINFIIFQIIQLLNAILRNFQYLYFNKQRKRRKKYISMLKKIYMYKKKNYP